MAITRGCLSESAILNYLTSRRKGSGVPHLPSLITILTRNHLTNQVQYYLQHFAPDYLYCLAAYSTLIKSRQLNLQSLCRVSLIEAKRAADDHLDPPPPLSPEYSSRHYLRVRRPGTDAPSMYYLGQHVCVSRTGHDERKISNIRPENPLSVKLHAQLHHRPFRMPRKQDFTEVLSSSSISKIKLVKAALIIPDAWIIT